MPDISNLTRLIDALCGRSTEIDEESYRITIAGENLDEEVTNAVLELTASCAALAIAPPVFLAGGDPAQGNDLEDFRYLFGLPWRVVLAKDVLATQLHARDEEKTFLFFSVERYISWLSKVDPFTSATNNDPDFIGPTTFRVVGLPDAFGGPSFWALPPNGIAPSIPASNLPTATLVQSTIHINADRLISINPYGWALTWGKLDQAAAIAVSKLSVKVLASCLVQELKCKAEDLSVTLRGTKLLSVPIEKDFNNQLALLPTLIEAVSWVYAERVETRLKLITDRLSIDFQHDESFLGGLKLHLQAALQQAYDSYAFVILERKDAYHKEMREIMKDMKSQADLYAAKVRDMVSSLTRDLLGILVFLGLSFIGKFDHKTLQALLQSDELSLLMKFMAGYLLLSCALQMLSHWRDSALSYNESQKWLSILQHYTSKTDNIERFTQPIDSRKTFLYVSMGVITVLYLLAAFIVWHLPFVASLLLQQR